MHDFSRRTLLALGLFAGACASAPRTFGVRQEPVTFTANAGAMRGTLYLPQRAEPSPLLVAYHAANGGSADFPFYAHLKTDLPARGIATFVFDRRGSNNQPGDFRSATFEDLARDGIAALPQLKANAAVDAQRIGAWGISQGGWIAPLATTLSDDFAFSISVSGPGVTPARQMAYAAEYNLRERGFSDAIIAEALALRARIDAYFRAPAERAALQRDLDAAHAAPWFEAAYFPLRPDAQLPDDVASSKWRQEMDFDPRANLSRLTKPLLAIYGARDRWVPVEESIALLRASVPRGLLHTWVSPGSGHFIGGHAEIADYNGEDPVEPGYLDTISSFVAHP